MLKQVWQFLKNPVYQEDTNTDFKYRLSILSRLIIYSLVLSFVLGMVMKELVTLFKLDIGEHLSNELIDNHSPLFLFGLVVILAPLLEEFFFRGPLVYFKKSRFFKLVFYTLTLIFGFYHITNFEVTTTTLLLSPLLVAPQLCIGVFLGFIRVRFGLPWSIALHACYNFVLIGPVVLFQLLDIPIE